MSDFKAKTKAEMHQPQRNLLFAGLRPRPRWRNLQRSPDLLAVFKELLLRGGKREGEEGEGKGMEREGMVGNEGKMGVKGRGGGRDLAHPKILAWRPLCSHIPV